MRIVRPPHAPIIDPERLERALTLSAEHVGQGRFRVTGGAETHWVSLDRRDEPPCCCGDFTWRSVRCKHVLAAQIARGERDVLEMVAHVVRELLAQREEARRYVARGRLRLSPSLRRRIEEELGVSAVRLVPTTAPGRSQIVDVDTGVIVGEVDRRPGPIAIRRAA